MCAVVVRGNWVSTRVVLNLLSLPCIRRKPVHMDFSQAESRLTIALLLVPVALQPAKGGSSSLHQTPGLGHSLYGLNRSHLRVNLCLCNLLFSPGALPGHTSQPDLFSALPTRFCVGLSYSICTAFLPVSI